MSPLVSFLRSTFFVLTAIASLTFLRPALAQADPGDIIDLEETTRSLPFRTTEAQFRDTMNDLHSIIRNYAPSNINAESKEVARVNHPAGDIRMSFIGTKTVLGASIRARFVAHISASASECTDAIHGTPVHPDGFLVRMQLDESDLVVRRNVSDLYGQVCFTRDNGQSPLMIRLRTQRAEGSGYQLINGAVLDQVLKQQAVPLMDAVMLTASEHPHN